MNMYILFAMCFLPMATLFALLSLVPRQRSVWRYALSCLLGIVSVAPASLVQFLALKTELFRSNTFASVLLSAIIFNGLIEEGAKLGTLLLVPRKNMSLWTMFCCALLLGTAAGSLETAVYLMTSLQKIALVTDTGAALRLICMRMFSSQAVHAFCAALSGIFIWGCHDGIRHAIILIQAAVLHGLFNFFIAFSEEFRVFAIAAILLAAVECRVWYKIVQKSEILPEEQLTQPVESGIVKS